MATLAPTAAATEHALHSTGARAGTSEGHPSDYEQDLALKLMLAVSLPSEADAEARVLSILQSPDPQSEGKRGDAHDGGATPPLAERRRRRSMWRDRYGTTPLHTAARLRRVGIVRALLASGADPSAVNVRGESCLRDAAEAGSADCVYLLSTAAGRKSEVAARLADEEGDTPLHAACWAGKAAAAAALLASGHLTPSEVDCENDAGRTPFHVAARGGHQAVLGVLSMFGASTACCRQDKEGFTPIHLAVAAGRVDCVAATLCLCRSHCGGPPNCLSITDNSGATAEDVARASAPSEGTEAALRLLERERDMPLLRTVAAGTVAAARRAAHRAAAEGKSRDAGTGSGSGGGGKRDDDADGAGDGTGDGERSAAPSLGRVERVRVAETSAREHDPAAAIHARRRVLAALPDTAVRTLLHLL